MSQGTREGCRAHDTFSVHDLQMPHSLARGCKHTLQLANAIMTCGIAIASIVDFGACHGRSWCERFLHGVPGARVANLLLASEGLVPEDERCCHVERCGQCSPTEAASSSQ